MKRNFRKILFNLENAWVQLKICRQYLIGVLIVVSNTVLLLIPVNQHVK